MSTDSCNRDAVSEKCWFAVYTAVNQERKVADELARRGVEHFLPQYTEMRRRSDRKVQVQLPLFPGYLFANIALQERLRVLEVPRVVRIVGFGGQPAPLPAGEIDSLRLAFGQNARTQPHPYLKKGERVRIVRGPFAGREGILARHKDSAFRVVLNIDVIMKAFAVELEAGDVEPIRQLRKPVAAGSIAS